jgi:hypothetical protein
VLNPGRPLANWTKTFIASAQLCISMWKKAQMIGDLSSRPAFGCGDGENIRFQLATM